ncbi:putative DNA-binding protein [Alteromonadaceae bacterium 2753L.S.0a.02]|nr:putative DNA-binding protein [Alteromonadaceae bacterium 2753L.S.0a.02]
MAIKEIQRAFRKMVFSHQAPFELETELVPYSREELEERLSIYRNNVYYGLIDALKETFTSVANMVGEDFFNAMTKVYIEQYPPKHTAMVLLGEEFPRFIASFEPVQKLPYLSDLARLDWARHCAYHAAEATPLKPEAFALIADQHLARAHFSFHPSKQLLRSEFAIFSLWELAHAEQKNTTSKLEVNSAESILVVRPDAKIETYRLSDSIFTFVECLFNGQTLHDALAHTMYHYKEAFNSSEAVAFLIASQLVVSIYPGASA